MNNSDNALELTAYCGLYCGDCIRYKSKTADLAKELLRELKNTKFDKYAEIKCSAIKQVSPVKQFDNYGKCCEVLEEMVTLQCNTPCRMGEGCPTFSCEILACCRNKGIEGCWQCDEFESCKKFEFLIPFHGDITKKNIKIIKEKGIDKWSGFRGKSYVWE